MGQVAPTGNYTYFGVYGNANGGTGTNYGVAGMASYGTSSIGVYGAAGGASSTNYAGTFTAMSPSPAR